MKPRRVYPSKQYAIGAGFLTVFVVAWIVYGAASGSIPWVFLALWGGVAAYLWARFGQARAAEKRALTKV